MTDEFPSAFDLARGNVPPAIACAVSVARQTLTATLGDLRIGGFGASPSQRDVACVAWSESAAALQLIGRGRQEHAACVERSHRALRSSSQLLKRLSTTLPDRS